MPPRLGLEVDVSYPRRHRGIGHAQLVDALALPLEQRAEVVSLANIFGAKVVDVAPTSVIVQITASEAKVDSLLELLRPCGILEMVRTGHVAMMRGETDGVRHTPGAGPNGVIAVNGTH